MTVYATARRIESIAGLEAKGCRLLSLDVTDEASMVAAVSAVQEAHGAVGALVNNAGYSQSGAIETVPIDDVRRQFETNVFGLMRLCQLVLPGMRSRHSGRIVNVSSMGGRFTFPGGGVYHASKHAVESISDALRFEVGGFGVQVVVIEPGIIRTNFDDAAVASMDAAAEGDPAYAQFNASVAAATKSVYEEGPLARLGGDPEAVARAIEKALTASRPKTRYRVTPSAKVLIGTRRMLPDRGWDKLVVGGNFPQPGKS